ncbi:MAG TPA: hypothetical protein VHC23_06515, partial [Jatrophihabitans sp.]|nr:hypothetical protein [Jatrophihabitans sp.]
GHPISGSTIQNMQRRGGTCQHALLVLWWLDRAPEEFVVRPRPGTTGVPLPDCDPDHRLRWNLAELYAALNDARTQRGGDVAAGRDPAALHRASAHRAAHRQVRHQHATGHADHPGAAASCSRLHRGRDLVTGRLS